MTGDSYAAQPLRVRANAAFWRYWAASATSTFGAGVTTVALPLVALTVLDASNFEVGLLTAAGYAAVVVIGLPAGIIVQRYELKALQVAMDTFRAVAVLTVPVAAWFDALTLAHLLVVTFFVGLASNLFDVANATFLPRIVSRDDLIARNGLLSGTSATTHLAGPAAGGLLVQAAGAVAGLIVDAFTYVVSAVLLAGIPSPGAPARPAQAEPFFRQIAVGVRFVFRHPVMRPSCLAATAVNFANGAVFAATPTFLVRMLGLPPSAVGLVLALDGLGTIVGAALTARLARRLGGARAVLLAVVAAAVLALAMPLARGGYAPYVFGFGLAGFGAGVCVLSVVTRTHRQTASPPELLSRVVASVRFVSWSAIPVGALCAGVVAEAVDPRAGLVVGCAAAFAAVAVVWASRIRRLREMTDDEPVTAAA